MKECLLFDCDGTLVDSERLCNIALVRKFKELGISLDADELVERFRGWKLGVILDQLESEYSIKLSTDFVQSYRQIVAELFESDLKPIEGIEYALENLPQVKAVVSSGPVHKINQALRICGLAGYFGNNIYSSYEVGIWKPDPGIYEYAAKDMGYAASDCAVIDDGPVGVEAGHAAGIETFFYNRFNEPCELSGVISFNVMSQLPVLLENSMRDNS